MRRRIKVTRQLLSIRFRLFRAKIFKFFIVLLYKVGQGLIWAGDKLSFWAFQRSRGLYWEINYTAHGRYDPVIRDRYSR